MPKLVLFGRTVNFASDDFVYAGAAELILRFVGLLVIMTEFLRFHHELDFTSGFMIHTYLMGLKIFFLATILLDIFIVSVSMKGSIVEDRSRQNIPNLLLLRLLVMGLEFLWTINGTVSIVHQMSNCDVRVYWLACATVIGGWMTALLQTFFIMAFLSFRIKEHQPVITTRDWEDRWKALCFCLNFQENRHVFSTIANLCSEVFKKDILTGTDILAGLVLIYNKQKHVRKNLDVVDAPFLPGRLKCAPHKMAISPMTPRKDWMTFTNAAYFMKYAYGSYGWFYYLTLNNPFVATCKLLPKMRWLLTNYPQIDNDNRWLTNTAAFCLQTGVHFEDIITASFHNEIYAIPFYVSVDSHTSSVIISIRGTLSLEDVMTDLVVERAPVCLSGQLGYVHTGMLQSAKYIRNKLLEDRILEQAFARGKDYQLVITGHSLGAGVAALLAIELRPMYPELICFAFAPPGELVSGSLVPTTEDFICSVALGYDVVPRLGLQEMAKLKIDILKALLHCPYPKHKVIASGIWKKIFGSLDAEPALHDEDEVCDQVREFKKFIETEERERDRIRETYEPLLPPGQILHVLERQDADIPWNACKEYYAEWTDAETFREIVLSTKMIAHHFPDTLLLALEQLAEHEETDMKKDK